MTDIELKKRSTEEMIENLVFDVAFLKVQLDKLKNEFEELKNDNDK